MEVKNEPVDREYNEEGHPPDDGWYHVPIVKPESLETFEEVSFLIKSEFQPDIGQPISKEEVALRVCGVNCEVSENVEDSTYFASEVKNQIRAAQDSASSLRPLFDSSQNTSQVSFHDIEYDVNNVKKEDSGHRPVVVVVNLQKKVFHDANFVCSICLQLFSSPDSLSLHRNDQHISMCRPNFNSNQFDDYGFESADSVVVTNSFDRGHFSFKTSERPFECDQCDYKSARKSNLNTHRLSHTGRKPFKCDRCDYKSATRSNVNQHKLSHTGEKPFECDQCHYKSAQKSTLNTHKLLHTGKKPFECDECDYKSARISIINSHKLSHTGEKPFECDRCNAKFSHKSSLNTHKLLHTGEKPFACDQCDYRSATRSNVNKHKLLHSGEKPFECDQCDYKTALKSALNRHTLRHTRDKPNFTHKSRN